MTSNNKSRSKIENKNKDKKTKSRKMKPTTAFVSLFCLCIVPNLILAQKPSPTAAMNEVCQHTSNKAFCIESLADDPSSFETDAKGLGLIALHTASSNASDMSEHIKVLFNDSRLDQPGTQQALLDCLDYYLDAAEQIDGSIVAFLSDAYDDVKKWIIVATDDAKSCEAAFPKHPSVLNQKNEEFMRLCNVANEITTYLASRH